MVMCLFRSRLPWLVLATVGLTGVLVPRFGEEVLALTPQAPRVVRELLTQGRYGEAQETAAFALAQGEDTLHAELMGLLAESQALRSTPAYRLEQVLEGIATGTAPELEGQVAGALTDLLPLVGDVRDLLREGWRWAAVPDQEPDGVIVTLSLLGLLTTGLPPLKSGLGVIKRAQRLQLLPPWLARELVRLGEEVLTHRSLVPVKPLLNQVHQLTEQVGVRDALVLLQRTTGREALTELVFLARVFGKDTASLVRLGGEGVVRASRQGVSPALLYRASLYGPDGIKALGRWGPHRWGLLLHGAKVVYRQPWLGDLLRRLIALPRWLWGLILVLGVVGLRPWPAPRRPVALTPGE